jgi:hypothetical protein
MNWLKVLVTVGWLAFTVLVIWVVSRNPRD